MKAKRYFFDLDAIREPLSPNSKPSGNKERKLPKEGLLTGHRGTSIPWSPKMGQIENPQLFGREGHSGYYDKEGNLLVNPLGKNPGDILEAGVETRTLGAIIGVEGAVKVPGGKGWTGHPEGGGAACEKDPRWMPEKGKNPTDFWTITTQPHPFAHFAVYPEKLIEPMVKAGSPEEVCSKCGAPKVPDIKITRPEGYKESLKETSEYEGNIVRSAEINYRSPNSSTNMRPLSTIFKNSMGTKREIVGYKASCSCATSFSSGVVLDPFMGSGTTALVALKLKRKFIGLEINPDYIKIAEERLKPYLNQMMLNS